MAVQNVITTSRSGIGLTDGYAACNAGGDSFPNTGFELVIFNNASGAPITITEVMQTTVDGQSVTNRTFSIGAGKEMIVGPFPTSSYSDGNGRMNFSYSSATSLSMYVIKPVTT